MEPAAAPAAILAMICLSDLTVKHVLVSCMPLFHQPDTALGSAFRGNAVWSYYGNGSDRLLMVAVDLSGFGALIWYDRTVKEGSYGQ
jgi:hypothetical protein